MYKQQRMLRWGGWSITTIERRPVSEPLAGQRQELQALGGEGQRLKWAPEQSGSGPMPGVRGEQLPLDLASPGAWWWSPVP